MENLKKLLLIINPNSGRGSFAAQLLQTIEVFSSNNYVVEVYPTKCEGDATTVIKERGHLYDTIVCCGGDGTANETVAGLTSIDAKPNLGIIPCGTTNDFGHTLGLPEDPVSAAVEICKEKILPCDTGILSGRPFIYVAAVGAFTELTYETRQEYKQLFGASAYVFEALRNLANISTTHLRVEYDDGVIEGEYLMCLVSNTVSMAGFRRMFENRVELGDGKFEVTLVKAPTSMTEVQKALSVLLSLTPIEDNMDFVTVFSSSSLTVTTKQPMPWTVDGQSAGVYEGVTIKVQKHSIFVYTT